MKYKTPKISCQNVISFTCSNGAIEPLLDFFLKLKSLGDMGSTRDVVIDWDGDGNHRLDNITINGLTLSNWNKEWDRLKKIKQ